MNAPQFTPGPWVLALGAAHPNVKELRWAEVSPRSCFPLVRDFMAEADARLIAAAPELYEALNELLELVCVHGLEPCRDFPEHEFDAIVDGAVQDSRKALAKARGQ